jgi:hypothetical protein
MFVCGTVVCAVSGGLCCVVHIVQGFGGVMTDVYRQTADWQRYLTI